MHMILKQGRNMNNNKNNTLFGQSLDLYLKKTQNDFAQNKWLHRELTSESLPSEYSEVFIST